MAEYEFARDNLSPKVFVLDDTSIIKCSKARKELLGSKEWVVVYDEPNIRHGASIFVHRDYEKWL